MKWLIYVGAVVVVVPLIIVLIGAALPKEHVASRKIVVKAPPDAVFALIAGPSDWRGLKYESLSAVASEMARDRFERRGDHL